MRFVLILLAFLFTTLFGQQQPQPNQIDYSDKLDALSDAIRHSRDKDVVDWLVAAVSAGSFVLLLFTVKFTKETLQAARDQAGEARKQTQLSSLPVIDVEKIDFPKEHGISPDMLSVVLRNIGRGPAFEVTVWYGDKYLTSFDVINEGSREMVTEHGKTGLTYAHDVKLTLTCRDIFGHNWRFFYDPEFRHLEMKWRYQLMERFEEQNEPRL
jgi:hypothetical protein